MLMILEKEEEEGIKSLRLLILEKEERMRIMTLTATLDSRYWFMLMILSTSHNLGEERRMMS